MGDLLRSLFHSQLSESDPVQSLGRMVAKNSPNSKEKGLFLYAIFRIF